MLVSFNFQIGAKKSFTYYLGFRVYVRWIHVSILYLKFDGSGAN